MNAFGFCNDQPIVASVNSTSATGSRIGGGQCTTTPSTVVTASAGIGSLTYAWARTSGSGLISANSASSASTTFHGSSSPPNTLTAVFTCTVTDSANQTNVLTVNVELDWST